MLRSWTPLLLKANCLQTGLPDSLQENMFHVVNITTTIYFSRPHVFRILMQNIRKIFGIFPTHWQMNVSSLSFNLTSS